MRGRSLLFVTLIVLFIAGIQPNIFNQTVAMAQDLRCIPLSLFCPIDMFVISPSPNSTASSLQPDIMIEVVSNTQELLINELRMTISGCVAPSGSGYRVSDSGVEYVTTSSEYFPHLVVYLDQVGCTLPSDSVIEVTVLAKSIDATGAVFERGRTWSFNTPDEPSGPAPQPPTSTTPLPQITSINAISAVNPGSRIQVNGTGFISTGNYQSYILFDSAATDYTGHLSSSNLEFYIPNDAECGNHTVQVANPRSSGQIPRYSNVYVLEMECDEDSPPSSETPQLSLRSFSPSAAGEVGDRITVQGIGFTRNSIVYFGRAEVDTDYIDSNELEFVVPRDAECEVYSVYVQDGRDQSNSMDFKVTDPCGPSNTSPPSEEPPNEEPPPPDDEPSPPPPAIGGDELEDYDTNGDCVLSDAEFFTVVDAWISASVGNDTFFSAVDAWISQSDICSATVASSFELGLTLRGLLINANNQTLGPIAIYDISGREVFAQTPNGERLFWNLRGKRGAPVANGVYFVRIWKTNEIRKVFILR